VALDPDFADLGEWPCLVDGVGDDGCQIHFRGGFEAGEGFDGGQLEQAVDQALAAGGFGADVFGESLAGFGRPPRN